MSGAIDPGRLRTRLVLEVESRTPDGCGGFATQWRPQRSVWAWVRPVSAARGNRAGNHVSGTTHEIMVRAQSDIVAGNRFSLQERFFDIEAVFDPDETGRYLLCHAIERR